MDPQFNNAVVTFSEIKAGNPNVRPEKADTYTMGVVVQPTPLKGFSLSVDWYSIDIKDAIGQLGAQQIINGCQEGARQLCAQITRDPITKQITGLNDLYLNINANKVLGTDIEADYATQFGRGRSLSLRLLGSYLGENSISIAGAPTEQQAGTTGSLSLPHVQLNAGINYNQGPYSAYVQERFISAGKRMWNDNDPAQGGVTIDDDHVASALYTDLNLGYHLGVPGSGDLQFFLNVTNLLDRPPPNAAGYGSFTGTVPTNATLFDVLGRRFVAGFKFNFM
jgi:outer membrane receptor protein involved in Fe transport